MKPCCAFHQSLIEKHQPDKPLAPSRLISPKSILSSNLHIQSKLQYRTPPKQSAPPKKKSSNPEWLFGATPSEALQIMGGPIDRSALPPVKTEKSVETKLKQYAIPHINDIHCHFFPDMILKRIWHWFDEVQWPINYRLSEADRVSALHRNRIGWYTTLFYAHKAGMAAGLNRWLFENYKNWPGAIPFGTFYPEDDALNYVRTAVEDYGFRGFKLHQEVSQLDITRPDLKKIFQYLGEVDIPVLIHAGTAPIPGEFTGFESFKVFKEQHPELKVIVAHMGAHDIEAFVDGLSSLPNTWLDTTMIFVDFPVSESTFRYLPLVEENADRIFFGTDFPNIPYYLDHPVEKILDSEVLSAATKRKLLYTNMRELLALPADAPHLPVK